MREGPALEELLHAGVLLLLCMLCMCLHVCVRVCVCVCACVCKLMYKRMFSMLVRIQRIQQCINAMILACFVQQISRTAHLGALEGPRGGLAE